MPGPRSRRSAVVVGLLTMALAFVGTVQLRSQAEVQRTLEGEDPASLAFLIDDLHRANDALVAEATALEGQRQALGAGSPTDATAALNADSQRLRIIEGSVAAHGPGVTVEVDAPLSSLDLQDAANNLRSGGAEALSVNDRRLVTGSVIKNEGDAITVDGASVRGPWTFVAIGDPDRLQSTADLMTRSLRSDPRVRRAEYRYAADLVIRATVAPRPFVYGSG